MINQTFTPKEQEEIKKDHAQGEADNIAREESDGQDPELSGDSADDFIEVAK